LSPDATQFADAAFTSDGLGTTAIFNVDGSGYRLLPTSDPAMPQNGLPAGIWSAGETMIAAAAGDPANPTPPLGIFSRRTSDGGGVIRLTDAGTRFDYPLASSPDGSRLLFFQPDGRNETSDSAPQDLFVVGSNGNGLTRLTPPGTTSAFVPGDSVSWSPDGTKVALADVTGPFWHNDARSVYIAGADGSSFRPIGPRGDIWDAVWSPDGRWIAFAMAPAKGGLHELYLMQPDGSGVRQLTTPGDGLSALPWTWSPDSRQLLLVRGVEDFGDVNIWSINVDGSHLYQVTHQKATYLSPAWLP
jgi:Tol biopolymer transport system component